MHTTAANPAEIVQSQPVSVKSINSYEVLLTEDQRTDKAQL